MTALEEGKAEILNKIDSCFTQVLAAVRKMVSQEHRTASSAVYHKEVVKKNFGMLPCNTEEIISTLNTALKDVRLSVSLVINQIY